MVSVDLFFNAAKTTVSSGGTTAPAAGTSESWTVASSTLFMDALSRTAATGVTQFRVVDEADVQVPPEVMVVTNVSGTTWTVTRGQENTAPVAHTSGFTVRAIITSGGLVAVATPNTAMFGTGADGALSVTTGTTTLTRDMFLTDLSVSAGATLATAGFRVYATGTATVSGTISNNGSAAVGSAAGTAAGSNSTGGGTAGGAGAAGAGGNGSASITQGLGGVGGVGGTGSGGVAGTVTTPTVGSGRGLNTTTGTGVVSVMDTGFFGGPNGSGSISGGGGGGGGSGDGTNLGRGGGGGGGILLLRARFLVVPSGGAVQAIGGGGGTGAAGNAAGGGGGGGGVLLLTYGTLNGSTAQPPTASAGVSTLASGGTISVAGGAGSAGAGTGTSGSAGSAGRIIVQAVSL